LRQQTEHQKAAWAEVRAAPVRVSDATELLRQTVRGCGAKLLVLVGQGQRGGFCWEVNFKGDAVLDGKPK